MSFWDQFVEGLENFGSAIAEWAPRILVALLVLIIGRWILRIVKNAVERILEVPAVQTVFEKAGITSALAPSGRTPAKLAATLIYAFLLVGLFLIVANVLQIEPIVDLLERLLAFLPLVFVAVTLVIIAAAVANFVAELVGPYAAERGVPWLTTAVKVVIILFGALAALDLLEITFAEDIVKIVVAALGVTFAVAFGIGGIDTAKQWWARYGSPRS